MRKLPRIAPLRLIRQPKPFDHPDWIFELKQMICDKDLEGIVAKHRASPYDKSAKWIKIKNPNYTQSEGRHEPFEKSGRKVMR
jgi:ATP-dependent DNA ligase